ncbi:MAG TPA: acyltransferase [Polyangiaceae bacterium]|jgi:peptidoglycan/LPS O-acetylase OafA/YrhL
MSTVVVAAGTPGRARPHVVALDGVRGLAILLVLCVHFVGDAPAHDALARAVVKVANYGIWGVDLFFVLSGFLITGLLHDAKGAPHYFRDFYVRRTLRIFPLYYGVLTLLFLLLPVLPTPYPTGLGESARHQAWLWLYASNVYLAIHRAWVLPYVGHFWSLAVEEQFYLVWPFVVLWCSRRALLRLCVVVAALALGVRIVLSAGGGELAALVLTPCRFDALCVGGFLALAVREVGLERVVRASRRAFGPLVGLLLATSAWNALVGTHADVVLPLRGTIVASTCGALLATSLGAAGTSVISRVFRSRVMRFLGTRSYGLYVFHGIVAYGIWEHAAEVDALAARVGPGAAVALVASAGAAVSVLVATASYALWEKPFLRLKNRYAPSTPVPRAVPLDARPAE